MDIKATCREVSNSTVLFLSCFVSLLLLTSCGGGGGGGSGGGITQGVFLDSAVEGVKYETETLSGITDADGTFTYRTGETVRFFIGGVALGSAPAAPVVTPIDLVSGASSVEHPAVTNIIRFLQSLDDDNFPDNGIRILFSVFEGLRNVTLDFELSVEDFETVAAPLVTNLAQMYLDGPREMVSAEQARAHMGETLAAMDGTVGGHRISHQFIFEPELTHAMFGMTKDIQILSRNTIEMKSWIYSYDAGVDQAHHLLYPPEDAEVTPPFNVPLVALISYHLVMQGDQIEALRGTDWVDNAKAIAFNWEKLNQRVSEMSYMREAYPGAEDTAAIDEDPYFTWSYTLLSPLVDMQQLALIEGTYLIVSRIRIIYPPDLEP